MTPSSADARPFPQRAFLITLAINAIWINLSEVFRYFAFVMGMMREALPTVEGVAPMSWPVFLRWGLWDMILVGVVTMTAWLWLERFGYTVKQALFAATGIWLGVFVIFWFGLINMNLATPAIAAVALPLAWLELAVAALIVNWALPRFAPAPP
ncbi:MAG: hypothetical protein AAF253_08020 [Pseudomonadota bacterium]